MLSCPRARAVGLDRVLMTWLDRGDLEPGKLSFSPLGAADPELLMSRFGRELEIAGHKPEAALDGYEGVLPSGYELALRNSHWAAIDWWLYRLPQLANLAPPQRGGLAWVPLQRVLVSGFLQHPETQRDMVVFLMARGASPAQALPSDPRRTVATFAAQMKSPMLSRARAEDGTLRLGRGPGRVRRRRGAGRRGHVAGAALGPVGRPRLSRWRSCRDRRARAPCGTRAGRGSSSGRSSASAGWRRGRRAAPRPRPESSSGCRRR